MSKADKMFDDLGYVKQIVKGGMVARYKWFSNYGYYKDVKFYYNKRFICSDWLKGETPSSQTIELHLAINEKMKELG